MNNTTDAEKPKIIYPEPAKGSCNWSRECQWTFVFKPILVGQVAKARKEAFFCVCAELLKFAAILLQYLIGKNLIIPQSNALNISLFSDSFWQ